MKHKKVLREKRIQELELYVRQLQEQVAELRGDVAISDNLSTESAEALSNMSPANYRDYLNNLASQTLREYEGPKQDTVTTAHAETPWNSDDEFADHVAYNRLKEIGMEDQVSRPKGKGPTAFINNMMKQTGLNEQDFIEFTEQLQKQAADTPVDGPKRNPVFMRDDEWLKITHEITNGPRRNSYSHPLRNFLRIAIRWSVNHETIITPLQVAQDMVEMKMARSQSSFKDDDWIDTMGYSNTVQMMNDKLIELGYLEGVKIFEGINMAMLWMLLEVCRDRGVGG